VELKDLIGKTLASIDEKKDEDGEVYAATLYFTDGSALSVESEQFTWEDWYILRGPLGLMAYEKDLTWPPSPEWAGIVRRRSGDLSSN